MKRIIAYYEHFNSMYFQKENMLKPLYLSKLIEQPCYYYYGNNNGNTEIPDEYGGVKMIRLNTSQDGIFLLCKMLCIVFRNAKNIDCLFTFHISRNIMILTFLLKKLNPAGHIWVSADLDIDLAKELTEKEFVYSTGIRGFLKRKVIDYFFKHISVFSVETKRCYDCFLPLFQKKGWNCLTYLPCGVDEDGIAGIDVLNGDKKENIILSVSRFGAYQKNTEMLLEGIANTDLKNWKVILVGPVTKDFSLSGDDAFKQYMEDYFKRFPHLKEKVIFTGPEYDPIALNNYFSKAKIFLMTSRFEAFANVFSQALWFRCHIMSTDVGGAQDMSNNWQYGTKLQQENSEYLSNCLQKLIDEGNSISYPNEEFAKTISYNYLIPNCILPKLNK